MILSTLNLKRSIASRKISSDPEEQEIKRVEKELWENIRIKAEEGRRTGIGITAEGDMLAALGLRYGSDDATDFSVEIHKTLAIEAYRSSVYLAKERGPFAIYDSHLEKNNPFIQRLRSEDENFYHEMSKYGRRKYCIAYHCPDRNNKPDDPNHIRY
jgi:ribonucleoside-diphosphate reductase alpha chain